MSNALGMVRKLLEDNLELLTSPKSLAISAQVRPRPPMTRLELFTDPHTYFSLAQLPPKPERGFLSSREAFAGWVLDRHEDNEACVVGGGSAGQGARSAAMGIVTWLNLRTIVRTKLGHATYDGCASTTMRRLVVGRR